MHPPARSRLLLRQIAAAVYDAVVAIALLAASGLCAQLLTHGQLFDASGRLQHGWFRPLQASLVGGYLLLSWRRGGQTLGMRAWHLELVSTDGRPPSGPQLLRRLLAISLPWLGLQAAAVLSLNATLAILLALWTLAYACGLIDSSRRTIQDRLAGTRMRTVD